MGTGAQATEIEIIRAEHDDSANVLLKKIGNYGWDSTGLQWVKLSVNSDGELSTNNLVSSIGDGTATVTTAGTRVQLSAQACSRVRIQAHESNTGTIVAGGSTVVATLVGRRGIALFATQSEIFNVNNVNLLYIDSTVSGDKITFYYEN